MRLFSRKGKNASGILLFLAMLLIGQTSGCGVLNLGEWKGLEIPPKDEKHWLVKDIFLTASSASMRRDNFDHTLQPTINLVFIPSNEPGVYVSKSKWIKPDGTEYKTIRQTHDKRREEQQGDQRKKEGTTRIHSVSTQDLWKQGEGVWTVKLYLDDELARRLEFTVQ